VAGRHEDLNDAVVCVVKSAGLSPEQVRRVIEFANTKAYLTEFNKEGAEHRYVSFEGGPADPAEVLRILNSGAGGSVFDRGAADYLLTPPLSKCAEVPLEKCGSAVETPEAGFGLLDFSPEESAFEQAFAVQDVQYPYADPLAEAFDLQAKLAGAVEHVTHDVFGLEGSLQDIAEELYSQVKQAALGGATLGQLVAAWQAVVPNENYVKVAFAEIGPRLVADEVFQSVDALGASLEKTAHRGVVNKEHPVVTCMSDFCLTLDKLAEIRGTQEVLIETREQVTSQLMDLHKTGGLRDTGGLVGLAKRVSTKGGGLTEKTVKGLGDIVVGRGSKGTAVAAKTLGAAVKYSPEAAAATGALAVGDKAHDKVLELRLRKQQRAMMRGGY
jgi:hypothetical protein